MNKKGFMFVETIVTLTVLMALLITIYTIFVNLLQKEKTTAEYDSYGDKYALFYYKENLGAQNMKDRTDKKFYNYVYGLDIPKTRANCNVAIITCGKKTSIGELETTDGGTKCSTVSDDFEKYKDYIGTSCPENAEVVMLAEFYNGDTYSYAHIYYPNIPTGEGG